MNPDPIIAYDKIMKDMVAIKVVCIHYIFDFIDSLLTFLSKGEKT